jgi:hypothetical protein
LIEFRDEINANIVHKLAYLVPHSKLCEYGIHNVTEMLAAMRPFDEAKGDQPTVHNHLAIDQNRIVRSDSQKRE